MRTFDTSQGIAESPYLTVERMAMNCFDRLFLVPPMSYEASVFIHRRRLALYSHPTLPSRLACLGVGGQGGSSQHA